MDTIRICPECGKPLAPNAPEGLCPECLIKAGLGTGVDIGPESQAGSGRAPFTAPTVEEVARLFPNWKCWVWSGRAAWERSIRPGRGSLTGWWR